MDDTAEIRERLTRIDALTGAGAARSDLLQEVRGLLEEGERWLRSEQPVGAVRTDGSEGASAGRNSERLASPTQPGEEEAVS
jgi:hypothetical protein